MKKIIRLTESDLTRIVKRVLIESEESVELELELNTNSSDKFGDTIRTDMKRDKGILLRPVKNSEELEKAYQNCLLTCKQRDDKRLCKAECEYNKRKSGYEEYSDLAFGYRQGSDLDPNNKVVIAQKFYKFPRTDANDPRIIYNCNDSSNELLYHKVTADEEQKERDKRWLMSYCDSITWKSRVGKKRNIFRNPKF
jgi:hypothetical protein